MSTRTRWWAIRDEDVKEYVRTKEFTPNTMLALRNTVNDVGTETANFKELGKVPEDQVRNFRNDMYLTSEALRLLKKSGAAKISAADWTVLDNYKKHIDKATKFIPTWVKVAVALALGLGTMVGWKRIVVTVGEKIGKDHLTYGQGAAAEITAMMTIGAADYMGLPVSTTHVLSSGVAGTMWANKSGLQMSTIRNLADGVGADPACVHRAVGGPVLDIQQLDEQRVGAPSDSNGVIPDERRKACDELGYRLRSTRATIQRSRPRSAGRDAGRRRTTYGANDRPTCRPHRGGAASEASLILGARPTRPSGSWCCGDERRLVAA